MQLVNSNNSALLQVINLFVLRSSFQTNCRKRPPFENDTAPFTPILSLKQTCKDMNWAEALESHHLRRPRPLRTKKLQRAAKICKAEATVRHPGRVSES
jgi:hypothetical protein